MNDSCIIRPYSTVRGTYTDPHVVTVLVCVGDQCTSGSDQSLCVLQTHYCGCLFIRVRPDSKSYLLHREVLVHRSVGRIRLPVPSTLVFSLYGLCPSSSLRPYRVPRRPRSSTTHPCIMNLYDTFPLFPWTRAPRSYPCLSPGYTTSEPSWESLRQK